MVFMHGVRMSKDEIMKAIMDLGNSPDRHHDHDSESLGLSRGSSIFCVRAEIKPKNVNDGKFKISVDDELLTYDQIQSSPGLLTKIIGTNQDLDYNELEQLLITLQDLVSKPSGASSADQMNKANVILLKLLQYFLDSQYEIRSHHDRLAGLEK